MEMNLIVAGVVFLFIGYLVGLKKQTWLLAGYNEKRVKDKNKLAILVGGTFAILGIGLLIFGLIGFEHSETMMIAAAGIILVEVVYVNATMVE